MLRTDNILPIVVKIISSSKFGSFNFHPLSWNYSQCKLVARPYWLSSYPTVFLMLVALISSIVGVLECPTTFGKFVQAMYVYIYCEILCFHFFYMTSRAEGFATLFNWMLGFETRYGESPIVSVFSVSEATTVTINKHKEMEVKWKKLRKLKATLKMQYPAIWSMMGSMVVMTAIIPLSPVNPFLSLYTCVANIDPESKNLTTTTKIMVAVSSGILNFLLQFLITHAFAFVVMVNIPVCFYTIYSASQLIIKGLSAGPFFQPKMESAILSSLISFRSLHLLCKAYNDLHQNTIIVFGSLGTIVCQTMALYMTIKINVTEGIVTFLFILSLWTNAVVIAVVLLSNAADVNEASKNVMGKLKMSFSRTSWKKKWIMKMIKSFPQFGVNCAGVLQFDKLAFPKAELYTFEQAVTLLLLKS